MYANIRIYAYKYVCNRFKGTYLLIHLPKGLLTQMQQKKSQVKTSFCRYYLFILFIKLYIFIYKYYTCE